MRTQLNNPNLTLRIAADADRQAVERLAALDSQRNLSGDVLLAEHEGEPWAAVEFSTGRAVADPFRPSAAAAALAQERVKQLSGHSYPSNARRHRYEPPHIRFA